MAAESFFPSSRRRTSDMSPHARTITPQIFLLLSCFRKFNVPYFPNLISMAYCERDGIRWSRSEELRSKHSPLSHEGKYISIFRKTPKNMKHGASQITMKCTNKTLQENQGGDVTTISALKTEKECTWNSWNYPELLSVLWKTFGEGSAQREIKLLRTTEKGKGALESICGRTPFLFQILFCQYVCVAVVLGSACSVKDPCMLGPDQRPSLPPTEQYNKLTSFPG